VPLGPASLKGFVQARAFVRPQVRPHVPRTGNPGGAEHWLDIGPAPVPRPRARHRHDGGPAWERPRAAHRHVWAVVRRHGVDHAVPPRRSATQASHREMDAGLIKARGPLHGQRRHYGPIGGARLFFRGSPRRWRARPIVATLPWRPGVSAPRGQRSSRVIAGGGRTASWITVSAAASSRRFWPLACGGGGAGAFRQRTPSRQTSLPGRVGSQAAVRRRRQSFGVNHRKRISCREATTCAPDNQVKTALVDGWPTRSQRADFPGALRSRRCRMPFSARATASRRIAGAREAGEASVERLRTDLTGLVLLRWRSRRV
jgi:hypothetical protein